MFTLKNLKLIKLSMVLALQKEMNLQRYFLSKLTSFVVVFNLLIFRVITHFCFYFYRFFGGGLFLFFGLCMYVHHCVCLVTVEVKRRHQIP